MLKPPQTFLTALELACNRHLRSDPDLLKQLATLDGKVIAVVLKGMDITLYLLPGPEGIRVLAEYEDGIDTELHGSPLALLRMGLAADSSDLLLTREVEIRGDVGLGETFKQILARIDFDWEEQLSRVTGDVIAHQVGNVIRDTLAWGQRTAETLTRDAGEYLREEARLAPDKEEIETFLGEIDELRSDTERLVLRVQRLQNSLLKDAPA